MVGFYCIGTCFLIGTTGSNYPLYIRDSSGYLVSNSGSIAASDNDYTSILRVDTAYPTIYRGTKLSDLYLA